MQEDDVFVAFLNGHVPVGGMFQSRRQIGQFMIMSREHRPAGDFIVQMFGDRPRQ
jgi:hypothetical protein